MKKRTSEVAIKWIELGLSEKDPEKKIHYFGLALELDPDNPTALNNKGMLLHRKEKFHEAIECYDRILNQYNMSKSVPALYNKALALKELGRSEAALNFMNKALKQQPENDKIKEHAEDLTRIIEEKEGNKTRTSSPIPAKELAVNQIYDRWEPPAFSTLLAHAMRCGQKDIKYYKGFGEDMIKEKMIQDNLNKRIYSCGSCRFQEKGICYNSNTKAMRVAPASICRSYRPEKQK